MESHDLFEKSSVSRLLNFENPLLQLWPGYLCPFPILPGGVTGGMLSIDLRDQFEHIHCCLQRAKWEVGMAPNGSLPAKLHLPHSPATAIYCLAVFQGLNHVELGQCLDGEVSKENARARGNVP